MDITLYEWLLSFHILFAAIWIGGSLMLQALYLRIRRTTPERVMDFFGDVEVVATRVFIPSSLILVLLGFWLLSETPAYEFDQTWVHLALAVFVASFLTGAGFIGPESGRITKLAEERGAADDEVQRRVARVLTISRVELLFLILVILDMVVKPGL
jgi:uncharacterized membrane protein